MGLLDREYKIADEGKEQFQQLHRLSDVCASIPSRLASLLTLIQPARVRIATDVHLSAGNRRAALVFAGAMPEGPEEYVVRVQGYAVRCKLPPTTDRTRLVQSANQTHIALTTYSLGDNPRQASQSLTLSGLGGDVFEKSVQGVLEVYSHVSRHIPQGQLQAWEPQMDAPFGGISMIFAGDFAQLPPAVGGFPLSGHLE